jgi:hypothetical protein
MLRSRIRIQPSSDGNVVLWLCLKYPNQPRNVGLIVSMIARRLCPDVRFVCTRIVSLSFVRLLARG